MHSLRSSLQAEIFCLLIETLSFASSFSFPIFSSQNVSGRELDLLRYLGHYWSMHGSPVLLSGTVRREALELNPELAAALADLGRDLPLSQVSLQPLSQAETIQLVQAIVGQGAPGTQRAGERREHGKAAPSMPGVSPSPAPERERPLVALGEVLFAQTGGQPLYLLETLKLL